MSENAYHARMIGPALDLNKVRNKGELGLVKVRSSDTHSLVLHFTGMRQMLLAIEDLGDARELAMDILMVAYDGDPFLTQLVNNLKGD